MEIPQEIQTHINSIDEMSVCERFDNEVPNWVTEDDLEGTDYEEIYDWYIDHNNKEAEDVVLEEMVKEIKEKFPQFDYDSVDNEGNDLDYHISEFIKDKFDVLT